ncbi:MAG TPA: heparinase II/III family protein, partial [Gemmatimonadales bacterium]|nr:heparinase II/III family protein [Gemmatimonadales bacterium]
MTLLLSLHALEERSRVARGELAGLQSSLLADLSQAMSIEVQLPGKARLTRRGGRCEVDSTLLEFNPASPHDHRCPACGRLYKGAEHHQWWAMGMQLWLAERAVHAAALNALTPMPQYARWAADLLIQLAGRYSSYPNSDNVLGPSRPFFSTYLESLWLLHICIALDLLEMAEEGGGGSIGDEVRERLIQPSAELIASFNEGASNRQLWNSTALTAANLQLGRADRAAEWAEGKHGILHQLTNGFMPDGTWYEGENYHQFALRGLWYGLTMFEEMGGTLADSLNERWRLASLAPFAVALPDFTLPARKDSQWATSLRQWRFAEHAELTFARWPNDPQIAGALGQLYATDVPVGDTGRSRSTGEAERNVPPSRLTREDLGWKSLLFALAELPEFQPLPPQSILQADQGYVVVRRDSGNIYAALDYGSSGGGHGHPDHLNLVLQQGGVRWFDDPGTGSYTDPTLSWYRSSLAHNVPLPDGRTQKRVPAQLLRFLSEIGVTLAAAQANGIVPGARVRRVLCVLDGYLIDHLEWSSAHTAFLDLPMHVPLELADASEWTTGDPTPDSLPDIGYSFLEDAKYAVSAAGVSRVSSVMGKDRLLGWLAASSQPVFWRANAPAAPGSGCSTRQMSIVRVPGAHGRLTTVWSWSDAVADVRMHSEQDARRALETPVAGRTAASHAAPGPGESPTGVLHMEVVAPDESTHRHSLGDTVWLVETEQSGNRKVVRISINEDSHDGAAFMPNATNALAIDSNASRTTLRIPTL